MRIEDKDKIFITPSAFLSDIVYSWSDCLVTYLMLVWHSLKHWWGCLESVRTSLLTKKVSDYFTANFFQVSRAKTGLDFIGEQTILFCQSSASKLWPYCNVTHLSSLINNNKCIPFIPSMPVDRDKTSKYRIKLDIILEGNIEVSLIPKSEDILKANSLTQKEAEIVAWRTLNRLLARNKQSEQYLAPTGAQRVLSGLSHVSSSSLFKLSKIR